MDNDKILAKIAGIEKELQELKEMLTAQGEGTSDTVRTFYRLNDSEKNIITKNIPDNKDNTPAPDMSDFVIEGTTLVKYTGNAEEVTVPNGIIKIGDGAFSVKNSNSEYGENIKLKKVVLPYEINEIGYGAFFNCINLEKINIPNSVEKIGGYAFYGCRSLEYIYIPDFVEGIGGYAFIYCYNLTVSVPRNCKCGPNAFLNCKHLIWR